MLEKFTEFATALINSTCPRDEFDYEPYCVTFPKTEATLNELGKTQATLDELGKTQATFFWPWAAFIASLLLAVVFLAVLLRTRTKSNSRETDLIRVKAENRQYRMKVTELQKSLELLESTTHNVSKIEPQSEVISLHSFRTKVFRTSKHGEPLDTCADMAYVNDKNRVFAIADGVSQAFNSAKWAEILVADASEFGGLINLLSHVDHLSKEWDADCSGLLRDEEPQSFVRQKQLQGSQSTLAVLQLVSSINSVNHWQFSTVGDSLLIALDSSNTTPLVKRFYPWSDSSDFPAGPDIISTKPPYLRGHIKTFQFGYADNESYLLMTDALARYAVSNGVTDTSILTVFPFLEDDQQSFETWIESARKNGLGDDDSTLISIFPVYE